MIKEQIYLVLAPFSIVVMDRKVCSTPRVTAGAHINVKPRFLAHVVPPTISGDDKLLHAAKFFRGEQQMAIRFGNVAPPHVATNLTLCCMIMFRVEMTPGLHFGNVLSVSRH